MARMRQHEITLEMRFGEPMARDLLEALTFRAQETLDAGAAGIALGAAASTNFALNAIEVDFIVSTASAAEVHERVAAVIRLLEAAGFRSADEDGDDEAFDLASSSTHSVDLVCASA